MLETIRMIDFKAGDDILFLNVQYRVTKTYTEGGKTHLTITRNGNSIILPLNSNALRNRFIKRTCAPCRDSDCDCIYDGVE